jgi:photosystem II stability/assembly factor-like uncharacterized protein
MRSILLILLSSLFGCLVSAEWNSSFHGTPSPAFIASDSSGSRIIVNMQDRAGIWLTNDGGSNWTQINDRMTEDPVIAAVAYCEIVSVGATADTMITTLYHGNGQSMHSRQFHTLDGGVTWASFQEVVTEFWPDSIANIIFDDYAIVLSDRIYYSRTDGFAISYDDGETWEVIDVGPYHRGLNGANFYEHDPDVIFQHGSWGTDYPGGPMVGGVIGSYDGGHTWARLTPMDELTNDDHGFVVDVCRGHENHVYAATSWSNGNPDYPPFLHSSDLGITWEGIEVAGFPAVMNVGHIQAVPERPGRLLTAGNYDCGVWESEDGGETWHHLLRGLPEIPQSVRCIYRNPHSGHLYLCILEQGIWRSTDFGDTWHQVPSPPIGMTADSWYDLGLIAGEGGVLHGYEGTGIYFAADDGVVFQSVPDFLVDPSVDIDQYPVYYSANSPLISMRTRDLWTSEVDQQIIFSEDDGLTWIENPIEFSGIYAMTAVETDIGLAIVGTSDASSVHVSHDLGLTWQQYQTGFNFPYALMSSGTDLYTVRSNDPRDWMFSNNYGEGWTALQFPNPNDIFTPISPVISVEDTLFFRVRNDCWAYLPDRIWQQRGEIHPSITAMFYDWDVVSTPEDTFMVGGSHAHHVLSISHDNGWTWEHQDVEMPGPYMGELATELEYDPWRDRLWLNTNLGLAYLDNPTTAVGEDTWVFQPATCLTVNAYPNPFNSSTTIEYTIQKPGEVKVAVYDILGRHVTTLYDGLRTPGTHLAQFDASDLASGSYILRLEADGQTVNRKLTIIK